jgi:hypothetical protein
MAAPNAGEPADRLLSRLERVQRRGADRWSARCPAHDDKGPSLSVRALPDGRALLHCFAGCQPTEVLAAIGLTLADLFERPAEHHKPGERHPWRDAGLDALRALVDEANVVFVAACLVAGGIELTGDELDRMTLAAERVNGALSLVEGGRHHG